MYIDLKAGFQLMIDSTLNFKCDRSKCSDDQKGGIEAHGPSAYTEIYCSSECVKCKVVRIEGKKVIDMVGGFFIPFFFIGRSET